MNRAIMAVLMTLIVPASGAAQSDSTSSPAKSAIAQAQENLDRAQQIYAQSCDDRAYATYNDLCNELSDQIHHYRLDLDRSQREAAKKAKAATPLKNPDGRPPN